MKEPSVLWIWGVVARLKLQPSVFTQTLSVYMNLYINVSACKVNLHICIFLQTRDRLHTNSDHSFGRESTPLAVKTRRFLKQLFNIIIIQLKIPCSSCHVWFGSKETCLHLEFNHGTQSGHSFSVYLRSKKNSCLWQWFKVGPLKMLQGIMTKKEIIYFPKITHKYIKVHAFSVNETMKNNDGMFLQYCTHIRFWGTGTWILAICIFFYFKVHILYLSFATFYICG